MKKESVIELEKKWSDLLRGPKRIDGLRVGKSPITVAESEAQLQQDEEYQSWLREKEEVRSMLQSAYREDAEPLIEDLVKSGVNVTSPWDLVNTRSSYKEAIPVLIKHLPKPYHVKNKEGIVRSLAVKEAKGIACRAILDEFHNTPIENFNYRWIIGNTMAIIMTSEYTNDVIKIVEDKSNGISRQMFVKALGKVRSEKTEDILINLLDDEDEYILFQALGALGNMKSIKAKNKISMLTNHSNVAIRKESLKAWNKIP